MSDVTEDAWLKVKAYADWARTPRLFAWLVALVCDDLKRAGRYIAPISADQTTVELVPRDDWVWDAEEWSLVETVFRRRAYRAGFDVTFPRTGVVMWHSLGDPEREVGFQERSPLRMSTERILTVCRLMWTPDVYRQDVRIRIAPRKP